MKRTHNTTPTNQAPAANQVALQVLLSQSEDDFYGSLQRIWNNVVQLEDMGIIQQENDKFMYAYRFAEAELKRVYVDQYTQNSTQAL
ncbi:hypothetical protein [Spirosoma foliorum]|uniref:Uncharacterized protein n=1 Tax=Spirosoma foliorum TaxID=2710596 RepID=A0A7G5H260_9BACT|nr:hypothetical protein [Spirosoma foliorum]QMW05202.1 hypothetical protein H3H32_10095 [Spirosoma foliorum]